MAEVREAARILMLANRALANEGALDAYGHISLRHPLDRSKFLLSCAKSPALVDVGDIMAFDLDGTPAEPETGAPYAERFIHGSVYQKRPDVCAVIHNHPREVLPFSTTRFPLRPILHMAGIIGGVVPVWDIRHEFGDTNMLVIDRHQADDLADTLGDNETCLMRGHGALIVGRTMIEVAVKTIYMIVNAEALLKAKQLGEVTYLTPGEIKLTAEMASSPGVSSRAWEYILRRAGFDTGNPRQGRSA